MIIIMVTIQLVVQGRPLKRPGTPHERPGKTDSNNNMNKKTTTTANSKNTTHTYNLTSQSHKTHTHHLARRSEFGNSRMCRGE